MTTTVTVSEALTNQKMVPTIFLDTRSSAEFAEDHLPGAINIPILSNEERALIGTIYRQVSQQQALEQGKEYFQQKVPSFLKEMEKYKGRQIIVNCWRGGMRSRVVADLLKAHGYTAMQLEGGYKQYRKYVRERLETYALKPKVVVLWGLTCVGKTALLKQFPNALDLEELAQHRGSLFGALGLQPHSQKRFENLILQRLEELQKLEELRRLEELQGGQLQRENFIIVEGESRKIGKVQIPAFLYKAMKEGIHILVKANMEARARNAVQEYFTPANIPKIREIVLSLQKVISKEKKEMIVELIDQNDRNDRKKYPENDQKKYQEAAKILLQHYYDPLYEHTLKGMEFRMEFKEEVEMGDDGKDRKRLKAEIEALMFGI